MQLMSQLAAEALMTGCPPGSPQGSAGSPGTPQAISQPNRDFLRADVTPQEELRPLSVNPVCVITGHSSLCIILPDPSSCQLIEGPGCSTAGQDACRLI